MNSASHRAVVDAEGNILLPEEGSHAHVYSIEVAEEEPGEGIVHAMEEDVWYEPAPAKKEQTAAWEVTDDDPLPVAPVDHVWSVARGQIEDALNQYTSSMQNASAVASQSAVAAEHALKRAWHFLTQPVWIPNKKKEPVQYSRGVLFMLDTVRFGGTFAFLFVALFVTLNYQSFWSIAQSYVHPLAEVTGIAGPTGEDRSIAEKLKRIPSLATAGEEKGALIEYLPLVGPPDDRIIIPKLDLNVPIVVPAHDALIREDWKQLEEDIQAGLQDGVVHYPGTARPGQPGNFFVTGHSSYFPWAPGDYKSVFARLHELEPGDEYWVFYNGDRYRYVIQGKREIRPSDVSVLDQPVNKRIGTLMTCTPVGTTLRRLIISAKEVDPVTGKELAVGEHSKQELPQVKMEMLPI